MTTDGRVWGPVFADPTPYGVLAPDLRGHGASTREPPFDLDRHLEDVLAVVDTVAPAVLVGHSFGGLVALTLAQRFPEAVSALVLVDPAIALEPPPPDVPLRWSSLTEARRGYAALLAADTAARGLDWFDEARVVEADGAVALPCVDEAVEAAWGAMLQPPTGPAPDGTIVVRASHGSLLSDASAHGLSATTIGLACSHDVPWAAPGALRQIIDGVVSQVSPIAGFDGSS